MILRVPLALTLVVAVGIAVSLAHATATPHNGLVAFSRYRRTDEPLRREIWVSNPDGSGQRRLTHAPANIVDSSPSWAPDGSRLVFTRCAPDPGSGDVGYGRCTIWTVNADGSHARMLSPRCGRPQRPDCMSEDSAVFSPDGTKLVFNRRPVAVLSRFTAAWRSNQIVVSDTALREIHSLSVPRDFSDVGAFAWSPDGKRIAYEARYYWEARIFIINADGTGRRRTLTPLRLLAYGDDRIDWSPDGSNILFHSVTSHYQGAVPRDGDLYTIRPDGTHLRRLTHLPHGSGVQLGSYSSDGRSIVFTTTADAVAGLPDVFVMRPDGTGVTDVSDTGSWEGTPDWGPG